MCQEKVKIFSKWARENSELIAILVTSVGIVATIWFAHSREISARYCEMTNKLVSEIVESASLVTKTIIEELDIPNTCWQPTGTRALPTNNPELAEKFKKWRMNFNELSIKVKLLEKISNNALSSWDKLSSDIDNYVYANECGKNWHALSGDSENRGSINTFFDEIAEVLDSACF